MNYSRRLIEMAFVFAILAVESFWYFSEIDSHSIKNVVLLRFACNQCSSSLFLGNVQPSREGCDIG